MTEQQIHIAVVSCAAVPEAGPCRHAGGRRDHCRAYFRSRDKRPHAAITVRLRDKMQNLMLQCLQDWHTRNRAA